MNSTRTPPAARAIIPFFAGTTDETTTASTRRFRKIRLQRRAVSVAWESATALPTRCGVAKASFVYELLISISR